MKIKQMTIPIFVPHQGCPHQCSFCNQHKISGQLEVPDGNYVEKTATEYLNSKSNKINRVEIAFFGGSFTGIEKKLQQALLSSAYNLKNNGNVDAIRLSTRPDYIDSEKIKLLKKFDVDIVELGVQSFFNDVLEASGRGHQESHIYDAIEILKDNNINFGIQLMPGLPKDTPEKSKLSAEKAAELNPYCVRIYPTIVLKNTKLEELFNNNKYTPLALEEAIDTTASMLKIFNDKKIPVIRIGLHPLNSEEEKFILAGPYRHNFGFLAKARLKRNILEEKVAKYLKDKKEISKITIGIPNIEKEEIIGLKRENILFIENLYPEKEILYYIIDNKEMEINND